MRSVSLVPIAALLIAIAALASAPETFSWLDEVQGARAKEWVSAENARSARRLDADPRYAAMYRDALAIAAAKDKLPLPSFQGGKVYSLWQDEQHPHGLWRESTLASFRQKEPQWHAALDLDGLSAHEHRDWHLASADCNSPAQARCMLQLSEGGEDAVTVREFDRSASRFVDAGFSLPRGKQFTAWLSADALLAARARDAGELTESGYPFVVRKLQRGEPLEAAQEVFRGQKSDVQVQPIALIDAAGDRVVIIQRDVSFFEHEYYLLRPAGALRLDVPLKADLQAYIAGRLILSLNTPWVAGDGTAFAQGSLIGLVLPAAGEKAGVLKAELIYAPGARDVLQQVGAAGNSLIVTLLDNVRGRARIYTAAARGRWERSDVTVPDNASVDLVDSNRRGNQAFLAITGFLTPASLWLVDVRSARGSPIKTSPRNFDASRDTVEQREAISGDGTRIPYFIVHAQGAPRDGSTPTLLTGYGGFQVSVTPYYGGYEWLHEPQYASTGKLWLERGRSFVVANIRGGGEFGPAWHEAGLKMQRQRIYDDFAAVARDLIAQGFTSPRRLGIYGWSNGGLLMGVEFTQHPDLWAAVDMGVPLLDMVNYEHIEAGASWASEFGSIANAQERAFLEHISPLGNLKEAVAYPEPFIWSTTTDDRVGPEAARRFAATLAALGKPYLYFEASAGGHDPLNYPPEILAAMQAREFTYFTQRLVD